MKISKSVILLNKRGASGTTETFYHLLTQVQFLIQQEIIYLPDCFMVKRRATYLGIIILLTAFISVNAQEFGSNVINAPLKEKASVQDQQGFKPDVRISIGTSFSGFGVGYNTFGTYVAPEISMPVTKKLSVQIGLGYSSLFYGQPGETMFGNTNSQYGSLYVSGTYLVNEKLSIRGVGYKTFLLNPSPPEDGTNGNRPDFSSQGVVLDIGYKVSEHFLINASFQYRQQNYTDYYFGYPQSGFGTPANSNPAFGGFGRSPFGF